MALASRNRAQAEQWAREFDIPRAYGSYEAILGDPKIDAVYIPLPNELHKPWVLAAADAGKHVLCEKPLALDSHEAAAMVEHCRRRGVILMEAFMWRHQERTLEIRKRVRDGAIGALRLVRSSFSFPIGPGDWRLDPQRGGGALWDVGCYGVSTARLFAEGEPRAARALAHFARVGADLSKRQHEEPADYDVAPGGVDLTLAAVLEFDSGVLATIDCSFEQPFRCHYELVGSRGVIEVPNAYIPPRDSKPSARLRSLGQDSDSSTGSGSAQVLEFEHSNQYGAMIDAFSRSVSAGRLVDPAEDGLSQMIALDQLNRDARSARGSG
jgi:predicted dehydrogenase